MNGCITLADAGVIIHGVNCQGVMGAGVALAIRRKWPIVYEYYRRLFHKRPYHRYNELLGTIQLVPVQVDELLGLELDQGITVINAFTQFEYGRQQRQYATLHAIDACLRQSFSWINNETIHTKISMPIIGTNLGGLRVKDVLPIIVNIADELLTRSEIELVLYQPK